MIKVTLNKYVRSLIVITIGLFVGISNLNAQDCLPGTGITAKDDGSKYGKGEDSIQCVTYLSLFTEYYNQKNYKDAYPHLIKAMKQCPRSTKNIYIRGAKIIKAKFKQAEGNEVKLKYLDTLMMMYDVRIQFHDERGMVLGQKGVDLYAIRKKCYEPAYKLLKESVDLEGDDSNVRPLQFLMRTSRDMFKNDKLTMDQVIDNYNQISEIVENNVTKHKNEKRRKKYEAAGTEIDAIFTEIVDGPALVKFYEENFDKYKSDINWLKKAVRVLNRKKEYKSDIYIKILEALHSLEPTWKTAKQIAFLKKNDKKCSEAIKYYKEALDKCDDNSEKAGIHIDLGGCLNSIGRSQEAYSHGKKALGLSPGNKEAYELMGDAIIAAKCGANELEIKKSYWLAYDYYIKAGSSKAGQYKKHWLKRSDGFTLPEPIKEGETVTIGCWIKETTKARFTE